MKRVLTPALEEVLLEVVDERVADAGPQAIVAELDDADGQMPGCLRGSAHEPIV